ncbi:hypothetical protein LK07_30185 [Streptomyces pluripotens]|uniref:Uncharacterized protein n=1 Tax=Streptomyces pluripotens TaxID=1355015 RepID=A0A221P5W5_9ACTN|nr:hypothetical protein [Streptomyces pluripotens]ARP73349.1 hypothetical protein LK06_029015 [Streptomyces pluripotens]ASN27597.1 hypothetical protein LK07_30185 [Streptomyces pluripotens]
MNLPASNGPAVLVFRTERPAHVTVLVDQPQGRRPRGYQLHGTDGPVVARIPLGRSKGRTEVGFRTEFRGARERWQAEVEGPDAIPAFDVHIAGQGFDVVHYQGEAGPGMARHRGRGDVVLQVLDGRLAEWATSAKGRADSDIGFTWPGPGHYQVRAAGAWILSRGPDA